MNRKALSERLAGEADCGTLNKHFVAFCSSIHIMTEVLKVWTYFSYFFSFVQICRGRPRERYRNISDVQYDVTVHQQMFTFMHWQTNILKNNSKSN